MWPRKKGAAAIDVQLHLLKPHDTSLPDDDSACSYKTTSASSNSKGKLSIRPRWKTGARYCAFSASLVFLLNFIFLLAAEGYSGFPSFDSNGGKRVIFDGQCDTAKKLNVGVHLLINVFGTVMLGASNYCMQCMSAPTRAEVDQAHAEFKWVDIGIPSVRNLKRLRPVRLVLWLLLGLSSLPLHLFYNSTVFASITANDYMVFSVNEALFEPSLTSFKPIGNDLSKVADHMFALAQSGSLERLSNTECIKAYAQNYQSAWGSVLLVVSNATQGFTDGAIMDHETLVQPVLSVGDSSTDPFAWICQRILGNKVRCGLRVPTLQGNIKIWQPFGKPIEYCMAERIEQHCRLEYSVHLVLVMVLIGFLKTVAMLYIAFRIHDVPMLTIGDAVLSFLRTPDVNTKGMCLLDRALKDYRPSGSKVHGAVEFGAYHSIDAKAPARAFSRGRVRHFRAASIRRWSMVLLTFLVLIGTTIFLQIFAIFWWDGDASEAFGQGLGVVDPRSLIAWSLPKKGLQGLLSNVLVANTPQLLLSFLYLNYNSLMTVMSLAQEWARYGVRRNGLRVSSTPRGAQRSTYFLQLPYRFGVPIMIITGVLHWLISQSIFFVSVDAIGFTTRIYEADGGVIWDTANPRSLMTCGYSPSAILGSILVLSLLLFWILGVAAMKLPSRMPVAASCSAAIAAACHVGDDRVEENAAEREVMWGVMGGERKGIGHCGFSARDVRQPEEGVVYS